MILGIYVMCDDLPISNKLFLQKKFRICPPFSPMSSPGCHTKGRPSKVTITRDVSGDAVATDLPKATPSNLGPVRTTLTGRRFEEFS